MAWCIRTVCTRDPTDWPKDASERKRLSIDATCCQKSTQPRSNTYGCAAIGPGLCAFLLACALASRESKGYSFLLGHLPPRRWLSREVPTGSYGERCNDNPRHGGRCDDISQQVHPRHRPRTRQRTEDERAGRVTRMHEHRQEQAPRAVVDPHHKHPVGW